jgi:hypothetical protein
MPFFISTSDFQHALHAIEAVKANCDAYVEKPFAETMEDNRAALKAIKESKKNNSDWVTTEKRVQLSCGSRFYSRWKVWINHHGGAHLECKPTGRWRRPDLVARLKEEDTDWKRFFIKSSV